MINADDIDVEVFNRAADRIALGAAFTCFAIDKLDGPESMSFEMKLWKSMHQGLRPYITTWFGQHYDPKNQIVRQQCLLEVELNMRAQGFLG